MLVYWIGVAGHADQSYQKLLITSDTNEREKFWYFEPSEYEKQAIDSILSKAKVVYKFIFEDVTIANALSAFREM